MLNDRVSHFVSSLAARSICALENEKLVMCSGIKESKLRLLMQIIITHPILVF